MINKYFLIFLFILRCRFPRGTSIADYIRRKYGENWLKLVRKSENVREKLGRAKLGLEFLVNCDNHGLVPKFLRFRLANQRLLNSNSYLTAQRRFLRTEIQHKRSQHRTLQNQLLAITSQLQAHFSLIDYIYVTWKLSESVKIRLNHQLVIQKKKFDSLQKDAWKNCLDPDKIVHNLSSYALSPLEKRALAKGLNFALPPETLKEAEYLLQFELLYRSVEKHLSTRSTEELERFQGIGERIKSGLKNAAFSSLHHYNNVPPKSPLSKAEFLALKRLSKMKNLVIQKADKGNSIVVMEKAAYIQKMDLIISDASKFTCLKVEKGKELNFIEGCEKKVRNCLNKIEGLPPSTINELAPRGSRPGRLYGLSKLHKAGAPLRPILSAIGTPTYKLAKFLVPIIAPITTNEHTIKDSFNFAKEITTMDPKGLYMASFDIESLFTNVPLQETIEICAEKLFSDQFLTSDLDSTFSQSQFKELLFLAVSEVPFIFNGKFYKQTDGVSMGSPLGPSFANAFLCKHEHVWLKECPTAFKPVYYKRYVDDTFLLFKSEDHVKPFLEYLNSRHNCIKFTHELEVNQRLNFLDISIERQNGHFATSVYRKPTFSGLYTNFDSFLPSDYKIGLVRTLLYRGFEICSNWTNFHVEWEFLRNTLHKNGYGFNLLDSCMKTFLDKKFGPNQVKTTVSTKQFLLVLPYTGQIGVTVKKQIESLFGRCMPSTKVRTVFKPVRRISMMFLYKDRVPKTLRSSVVYKFTCAQCQSAYVGCTTRHLKKRISEHIGISHLTGKQISDPKGSAVFEHCTVKNCNRPSFENFTVLYNAETEFQLKILESLEVNKSKPSLNRNIETLKLSLF